MGRTGRRVCTCFAQTWPLGHPFTRCDGLLRRRGGLVHAHQTVLSPVPGGTRSSASLAPQRPPANHHPRPARERALYCIRHDREAQGCPRYIHPPSTLSSGTGRLGDRGDPGHPGRWRLLLPKSTTAASNYQPGSYVLNYLPSPGAAGPPCWPVDVSLFSPTPPFSSLPLRSD